MLVRFLPWVSDSFSWDLTASFEDTDNFFSWLYVGLTFVSILVRFLPWVSDAFSWILGLVGKIKFSIAAGHMESAIGLLSVQRRAN